MDSPVDLVLSYRCDICQVATFPTMEEAIAHENLCAPLIHAPQRQQQQQPPNPPQAPICPVAPPSADATFQRVQYFKCDNCKILFADKDEARAHEKSCTEPAWFSCRVCNVMRFAQASDLIEHERGCQGSAPLSKEDLPLMENILKQTTNGNDSSEVVEPPFNNNSTSSTVPPEKDDDSVIEVKDSPSNTATAETSPASPSDQPAKRESQYTTVWTCDVCNDAHFKTYEEAEQHEIQCRIIMDKKAKQQQQAESLPAKSKKGTDANNDSRQQTKNVVLFSPFVQSVTDSADFEKISNCHAAILQSVKLLHHPFSGSVGLQCQYCSEGMSTTWTFKKMTEMLPVQVCNHILDCQHAPAAVVDSMQQHISDILNKSSDIIGDMPFEKFLESFLLSNGIVEGVIKGNKQLVLLPDEKCKNIEDFALSKRGRLASPSTALIGTKKGKRQEKSSTKNLPSSKRPRQQQSSLKDVHVGDMDCQLHYDDGRSMYVGPLNGIPLLTSLLQKEAKLLHLTQKVLLSQLEIFEISPKLMKEAPEKSLGIRCQNCVTEKNGCCYMKLSSIDKLGKDILLFGEDHVCNCVTKPKVVKQLRESLVSGGAELTRYCKVLAKLYCMSDVTVDGKSHVMFGDCPKIPDGYTIPCDIDCRHVSLREVETKSMDTSNVEESIGIHHKALAQDEKLPTRVLAPESNQAIPAGAM